MVHIRDGNTGPSNTLMQDMKDRMEECSVLWNHGNVLTRKLCLHMDERHKHTDKSVKVPTDVLPQSKPLLNLLFRAARCYQSVGVTPLTPKHF